MEQLRPLVKPLESASAARIFSEARCNSEPQHGLWKCSSSMARIKRPSSAPGSAPSPENLEVLKAHLGSGVQFCHDRSSGRQYVAKVIDPRNRTSAIVAALVRHKTESPRSRCPQLVSPCTTFERERFLHIVYDFTNVGSLYDVLQCHQGPMCETIVADLAVQLLHGLACLHGVGDHSWEGEGHPDINPMNILVVLHTLLHPCNSSHPKHSTALHIPPQPFTAKPSTALHSPPRSPPPSTTLWTPDQGGVLARQACARRLFFLPFPTCACFCPPPPPPHQTIWSTFSLCLRIWPILCTQFMMMARVVVGSGGSDILCC